MKINNLTIGEAIEMISILDSGLAKTNKNKNVGEFLVGKYAIIRSRNEGLNAGVVVQMDDTGVVIKDARRIWYHKPADKALSWYEGVAVSGLSEDSKISGEAELKVIIEDYSITACTTIAEKSIREHPTHEQN